MNYTNEEAIIFTKEELSAIDKVREMILELRHETPYRYEVPKDIFKVLWDMRRLDLDTIPYYLMDDDEY